jgi:hypothetical protein
MVLVLGKSKGKKPLGKTEIDGRIMLQGDP